MGSIVAGCSSAFTSDSNVKFRSDDLSVCNQVRNILLSDNSSSASDAESQTLSKCQSQTEFNKFNTLTHDTEGHDTVNQSTSAGEGRNTRSVWNESEIVALMMHPTDPVVKVTVPMRSMPSYIHLFN